MSPCRSRLRIPCLAALLLAGLVWFGGCGGEFWGGLGDWEPGELGAARPGPGITLAQGSRGWPAERAVVSLHP